MAGQDPQLVRAVSGDEAALQCLLLEHHDALAAHISGRLPNDLRRLISVEDVLQEAYLTVFRKIAEFEPREDGGFSTWLMRISEHSLSDLVAAQRCVKRGGGRVRVDASAQSDHSDVIGLLAYAATYSRTPSQSAAEHEAVAAVANALADLKDDQRDALRTRYLEGLSVAETASRLGRSEGAVHMLCNRGLAALRQQLGDLTHFLTRLP